MPKQFNKIRACCELCGALHRSTTEMWSVNHKYYCEECYQNDILPSLKNDFNKPTHYHTHDIDTIEFLKRGFPPQVLTGFLIGNIIKYTQRFEYKNGEEDVLKIVDYAKRLEEWYKETHS